MTKLEALVKIVDRYGLCGGVACSDCPFESKNCQDMGDADFLREAQKLLGELSEEGGVDMKKPE